MYLDVVDLRAFYAEHLGQIAARLVGARLRKHWPSLAGERLLGVGYATPYLPILADGAERTIAFMPAAQGVVNWPPEGPNAAALVADDALPLPDAMIDRVLVIHSLEMSESPRDQLREIWRVLAPGGRMILVVPNRRGIWAWAEKTPFGYGRPFTRGQLTALLRETMFSPLAWSEALAAPPIRRRPWIRSGWTWEQIGVALWGAFAGVIIVEATKQLYKGIPVRSRGRRQPAFSPALVPPAASACDRAAPEAPPWSA
jgi:SAM-dependent methyltransferase